jgi:hypothetical protein
VYTGSQNGASGASVALTDVTEDATGTPLLFFNPPTSIRYASLIRWELAVTASPVTPVIGAYCLCVRRPATLVSPTNIATVLGGISVIMRQNAVQTSNSGTGDGTAGTIYRPFVSHLTGAASAFPNYQSFSIDLEGTCIVPPNTLIYVAQLNSDATNASITSVAVWEEFYP